MLISVEILQQLTAEGPRPLRSACYSQGSCLSALDLASICGLSHVDRLACVGFWQEGWAMRDTKHGALESYEEFSVLETSKKPGLH